MEKVKDIIAKWGYVAFLGIVGITLLFGLGSCLYTSITNAFVGITGLVGAVCAVGVVVNGIIKEVKR